ncbi:AAEL008766-PB [Aedes aegypti]|uniref:Proline rich salivary secreted peptide n=2 Tax=Aedes aegypti TaxID=7159 RepID=Q1HRT1_AEDAE|nr:uncharacterized protein LOC5571040 [Aedes aegypti]ABF18046.1 proline rich salivary secreted peptide [Aedes aegypti]EAT39416.1 AAEL008766-PB [Aedes aegypti]
MVPAQLTIAVGFLFAVSVCPPSTAAKKSTSAARTRSLESSLDDELIPSYECAHRSRDWTLRCMVPVTNFQMSLDLCGTKQKPDEHHVQGCVKELYILGKSCPQTSMMDAAKEMMHQKSPPPPPSPSKSKPKKPQPTNPLENSLPQLSKAYSTGKNSGKKKEKFDL